MQAHGLSESDDHSVKALNYILEAWEEGTESGIALEDRRLPIVPDFTGRLAVEYTFDLGGWKARLTGQANYVGKARLAFDPNLDRQMGGYLPVAATATLVRDGLVLSARIDNLLDIKGDSFAFGNQFSILSAQQYTPLRPRTRNCGSTRRAATVTVPPSRRN